MFSFFLPVGPTEIFYTSDQEYSTKSGPEIFLDPHMCDGRLPSDTDHQAVQGTLEVQLLVFSPELEGNERCEVVWGLQTVTTLLSHLLN